MSYKLLKKVFIKSSILNIVYELLLRKWVLIRQHQTGVKTISCTCLYAWMNISQIKRTLVSPTFHIHRPSEECIENSVTFCGNQMKEIQQGSCCKHFIISYLPFSLIETSISPLWIFRFKTVYHIQHDIFLVLIWYNICHDNLCDPYIISSKS